MSPTSKKCNQAKLVNHHFIATNLPLETRVIIIKTVLLFWAVRVLDSPSPAREEGADAETQGDQGGHNCPSGLRPVDSRHAVLGTVVERIHHLRRWFACGVA